MRENMRENKARESVREYGTRIWHENMAREYGKIQPPALTPNWVKTGAALLRRRPALPRRRCRRPPLFFPVGAGSTTEALAGDVADAAVAPAAPRIGGVAVRGI